MAEVTPADLPGRLPAGNSLQQAKIVARGTGISLVGATLFRAGNYLLTVVLARAFGASLLGVFSLAVTSTNLARILALLGLDLGVTRYVARFRALEDPGSERRLVRTMTAIVAVWSLLLAAGLLLLAGHLLPESQSAQATAVLRWFAPAVPLGALLYLHTAVADGRRRVAVGSLVRDTLQPLLALLLALVVIWVGGNMVNVAQVYLFSLLLAAAITFYYTRQDFTSRPVQPPIHFSAREIVAFSLPLFPIKLMNAVGNRLEIFLLGFLVGPAAVGIFAATAGTASLISFGLQGILRIYTTLAAELHATGRLEQLAALQNLATRWATAFSLPVLLALILLAPEILHIFGDSFAGYQALLIVLALGQFVNAASGPIATTLHVAGYTPLLMVNSAVALAANIALDLWLIRLYGPLGAAVGSALALALLNLAAVVELRLLLGLHSFGRHLLRPGVAGALAAITCWLLLTYGLPGAASWFRLAAGMLTIGVVFSVAYWSVAPAEDRQLVRAAIQRLRRPQHGGR